MISNRPYGATNAARIGDSDAFVLSQDDYALVVTKAVNSLGDIALMFLYRCPVSGGRVLSLIDANYKHWTVTGTDTADSVTLIASDFPSGITQRIPFIRAATFEPEALAA